MRTRCVALARANELSSPAVPSSPLGDRGTGQAALNDLLACPHWPQAADTYKCHIKIWSFFEKWTKSMFDERNGKDGWYSGDCKEGKRTTESNIIMWQVHVLGYLLAQRFKHSDVLIHARTQKFSTFKHLTTSRLRISWNNNKTRW